MHTFLSYCPNQTTSSILNWKIKYKIASVIRLESLVIEHLDAFCGAVSLNQYDKKDVSVVCYGIYSLLFVWGYHLIYVSRLPTGL